MPYGRKGIFGTLRFRLTFWNTAVVLFMVVVTLWGVRESLRFSLYHEADEQLLEDAKEVKLTIEQLYPDVELIYQEIERKAISHTHRGLYVKIFDEQENLYWKSENTPTAAFPLEDFKRNMVPASVLQYRLVHFQLEKPGIPRWTIRVGTSFEELEADVKQVTELMLIVGAVVILVAPLGGYWLAGRATHPLAKIIAMTAGLHPGNLDERLPLRGSQDELDRLSATINGLLDRIAAYLERHREFTANAAHELRSPLAAIQSSLEVTLNADRSVEVYREMLTDILGECENLRVVVNQLLLLAESEAGQLHFSSEPIQLDHIVQKAADMFGGVAEAADISFRIARLEKVRVDGNAGHLRQVVNNLLDNAIKFTRTGGSVEIDLFSNPVAKQVLLRVKDTGMGIDAEDLPHVFERFYRGDKSRRREKQSRGTGLGLTICNSIINSHGGRIDVESVLDRGTTFTIVLPSSASSGATDGHHSSEREFTDRPASTRVAST